MYSTSEALTNAIINGEPINKELRLLGSDGVVIKTIKSLKLYSGSNSTSRIQIGSTNSSYIEASIEYDKVLANREMALYCGIDSEMIPMGIYKIMQEPAEDDGIISFKAYDRMRLLDKLYEPTVAIPNGFKNVVDDIAKQCGVTVNFSYTGGTVRNYIKGYTCREMIGYIASMLGEFAYFDRQGVLNFGWYTWGAPVEKTLSSFWSLKKNSSDYKVTGVEFIANSDTKYLAGSEPNIIYCSNPFADRGDADAVYYGPMRDLTYRPAEISMLDDIRLDVTDVVKVTLLDGTTIEVPCMTLNQDFTASETKVKAVGNADGEASNYSGPLTTAMDRMTTDLLLTNRVVATKVDADWVRANTVTVDKITAIQAEIDEINANNITTDNLSANVAKLGYLTADSAVIKGKLDTSELSAEVAKLGYLTADSAVIKGKLDTNQLSTEVAKLGYMTADEADIKYANIKLTNIETANVATLLAKIGLIDRATIVDGHITGFLDAVEVNANSITAGTLIADRILLKGSESGLLYALNNLGELTSTEVDTLDGTILTQRTVTADKLVANSITANELDVENIFANEAVLNELFAQNITATGSITSPLLQSDDYIYTGATIEGEEYSDSGMIVDLRNKIIRTPKFCLREDGTMFASEIHGGKFYSLASPESQIAFIFHGFTGGNKDEADLLKVSGNSADGTSYTTYINTDNDLFQFMKPCAFPYGVSSDGITSIGDVTAEGDIIAGLGTSNQVSLQTLNSILDNTAKLIVDESSIGTENFYRKAWRFESGLTILISRGTFYPSITNGSNGGYWGYVKPSIDYPIAFTQTPTEFAMTAKLDDTSTNAWIWGESRPTRFKYGNYFVGRFTSSSNRSLLVSFLTIGFT